MENIIIWTQETYKVSRVSMSKRCRRSFCPAGSQLDSGAMDDNGHSSVEVEEVHFLSERYLHVHQQGISIRRTVSSG